MTEKESKDIPSDQDCWNDPSIKIENFDSKALGKCSRTDEPHPRNPACEKWIPV